MSRLLPSDLSSLAGWWKGDGTLWQDSARTTPAVADGDPVGAWDDLSGNGRHVTQATSTKRPLLKLNVVAGKPTVRFDGTDDFLSGGDILDPGTNDLTAFVVVKHTGNGAYFAKSLSAFGVGRYAFFRSSADGGLVTLFHSTATGALAPAATDTSTDWRILSTEIFRGTSASVRNWRSGALAASSTNQASSSAENLNTTYRFLIGAYNNGTDTGEAFQLNGDLAEVIIYTRVLTAQERSGLVAYLTGKYDLAENSIATAVNRTARSRRLVRV